ncbi:MAG: putative oxidoreductase [Actinomycetota bacterium]|jgi:putative oxidoreductase|nr:putative oxidoreductase [Actinomycetota bacterium]
MEIGLLLLRLVIGGTLAAHGAQKLFGWFGGFGIAGTGGWLESMGFRPGKLHAAITGLSEFGGGLLLALGLLTPLGAAAIAGVMLVAILTVHLPNGFIGNGGYEFNTVLAIGAIALAFTGPGDISLDNAFGFNLDGGGYGLAAALAVLVASGFVLATRNAPAPVAEVEAEQVAA